MSDREAMKLALEALMVSRPISADRHKVVGAIEALRDRLAAPEPEPVAWQYKDEPSFDGNCWHDNYQVTTSKQVAQFKDKNAQPLYATPPAAAPESTHPGCIIGSHWLETAYSRVCAGEAEADVLRDCGWERVTDADALRRDAERYRYLRNRDPKEVFGKSGEAAGVWIDWEDDMAGLQLLTGDDADAAIDAAIGDKT